jgi:hypothetical protein
MYKFQQSNLYKVFENPVQLTTLSNPKPNQSNTPHLQPWLECRGLVCETKMANLRGHGFIHSNT